MLNDDVRRIGRFTQSGENSYEKARHLLEEIRAAEARSRSDGDADVIAALRSMGFTAVEAKRRAASSTARTVEERVVQALRG